jgi:hypothetical protein
MPRDFRNGSGGGAYGPLRTASLPFVAAGDDTADALLKARVATANREPFTAEHSAAYAAFAGITDRKTALALHRGNVSFDDVSDYSGAGVGLTAYRRMIALRADGITPAVLAAWAPLGLPDDLLGACVRADLTPDVVRPYLPLFVTSTFSNSGSSADRSHIPDMVAAGLTAEASLRYTDLSVRTIANQILLHRKGCTPDVINAYRQATTARVPEDSFLRWYCQSVAACGGPSLPNAVYATGGSHADVLDWLATGHPVDLVTLFIRAGFTATEVSGSPAIATMSPKTLIGLGSLRGHVHQQSLALAG